MDLVSIENVDDQLVVSSRVIAEQLGKRHDNVIRDLENIIKIEGGELPSNLRGTQKDKALYSGIEISSLFIKSEYIASNGKRNTEYLLTKDGFTLYMFNIQGHNDFKLAYINEFNRMERALNSSFRVPKTMREALEIALEQAEKIEKLEAKILNDKSKVDFYDVVADSSSTCDMQTVAKLLNFKGVGRNTLFEILRDEQILQMDNKPYQKYVDRGWFRLIETKYNDYKTGDLRVCFKTVVFQRGIEEIARLLNLLGYERSE